MSETYFYKKRALADHVRFVDPRDGKYKCLMWDEDGAYPFAYYDNELYIGDESTMHSNTCKKYIQDCVYEKIGEYGLDAEDIEGTFVLKQNDYTSWYHDVKRINFTWDEFRHKYGYCGNDEDDEEEEVFVDWDEIYDAEYEPTNNEIDNYIQSSYDSGRYWVYDKIIVMWGGIDGDFGDIIFDLTYKKGSSFKPINFKEFYVVYEDENDGEVKCELVDDVIKKFSNNDAQHDNSRYANGFVPHVPSQLERGSDMNDFYRERKESLKGFMADRNDKMNKKLAIHDHDGNTVGVMPTAQYNHLRHPYGESVSRSIDNIIKENINRFLVSENISLEDSRKFIPKVRGGWTENKILRYLKSQSSDIGLSRAIKEIASFDNAEELKQHLFWHGSPYSQSRLRPSITKSENWAARYGGGGYGDRYYGISLTNVKKIATNFDYLHQRPSVHLVVLKKDAVIKNMEGEISDSIEINDIIVDLYTEGVDGVYIGGGEGELVVINPYAIINVTEAIQYFDLRYGHDEHNPSHDNPLEEELQDLLDSCKEYAEFTKNNKCPCIPIEPKILPHEDWKKYDWYDYDAKMKEYNHKLEAYNKYKSDPSEIDAKRQPFIDRKNKIINQLLLNKKNK